jgi:hypothetical protein
MHMVYDSDSFAVVRFDAAPADAQAADAPRQGGYEIVDKFGRKDIFLAGALAESFQQGVDALMARNPSQEDFDEYLAGFAALASQPLVLH